MDNRRQDSAGAEGASEPVAPDAGSPGGMGGARAGGGTGADRPPGGRSPAEAEEEPER
jgi:hypothetical protein